MVTNRTRYQNKPWKGHSLIWPEQEVPISHISPKEVYNKKKKWKFLLVSSHGRVPYQETASQTKGSPMHCFFYWQGRPKAPEVLDAPLTMNALTLLQSTLVLTATRLDASIPSGAGGQQTTVEVPTRDKFPLGVTKSGTKWEFGHPICSKPIKTDPGLLPWRETGYSLVWWHPGEWELMLKSQMPLWLISRGL